MGMARKCCVKNCELDGQLIKSDGLPIHKFPKEQKLFNKWIENGQFHEDFIPLPGQFICYKHFKKSDYNIIDENNGIIKFIIKKDAVPTIFDHYDQHPDPVNVPASNEEHCLNDSLDDGLDVLGDNITNDAGNLSEELVKQIPDEILAILDPGNIKVFGESKENGENETLQVIETKGDEIFEDLKLNHDAKVEGNGSLDGLPSSNDLEFQLDHDESEVKTEESVVEAEIGGKLPAEPSEIEVKVAEEAPHFPDVKSHEFEVVKPDRVNFNQVIFEANEVPEPEKSTLIVPDEVNKEETVLESPSTLEDLSEVKTEELVASKIEELISSHLEETKLTEITSENANFDIPLIKNETSIEITAIESPTIPIQSTIEDNNLKKLANSSDSVKKENGKATPKIDKSKIVNKAGYKFFPGAKLEAKDFNEKWYPARVVETDWVDREVLIHFDQWSSRFDEWIPMDSSRLRDSSSQPSEVPPACLPPIQDSNMREFQIGERVLATWGDGRKYPAKVNAILGNDRYDVLFDDGYQKIVRSSKMTKIASSTAKNFEKPLEPDPYIGSKQERRDKKRKHTVMELFQHKKKPKTDSSDKPMKKEDVTVADVPENFNLDGGSDSGVVDPYYDSSSELNQTFDTAKSKSKSFSRRKREYSKPDSDNDDDDGYPEWIDGQPKGIESHVDGNEGSRKSVIIADKKLLPGWQKHFIQRKSGSSAGKWDVVFVHEESSKKFRSKNDIRLFFETQGRKDFDIEKFDFCIHRRKKVKTINPETTKKIKTLLPKAKTTAATPEVAVNPISSYSTPVTPLAPSTPVDNSAVFIGGLRVEMEDSAYKCPKEGCSKTFRKENLLQMHIKHYHPEYTKYLGSTPNVADLAYARTIGESIVDITPKKTTSNFTGKIEKKKLADKLVNSTSFLNNSTPSFAAATPPIPDLSDQMNGREESKVELMSPISNFSAEIEEEMSKKSDVNAMSPSTLFDMKVREEKVQGGIKTLLPVRPSLDAQKGDKVKSLDETIPFVEKGKGQRKRQLSEYSSDTSVKSKRRTDDFGELDDSALDAEGPSPVVFRYSRRKSDAKSDDNSQSSQLNDSQLEKNPTKKDSNEPEDGEGVMMMINGELVKVEQLKREEIINCTCGFMEEDGLMIQCDLCLCWQHGHCNAIEREKDVPEKYICYICRYPYRQRPSKKYLHDQEWIKEGKLQSLSKRTKDQTVINQRSAMLKRSYDLVGALLQIQQILHSLRVKINVAQKKDHPKLYLWAKNWAKSEIPAPNLDPIPVMEIINSELEVDSANELKLEPKIEVKPADDLPDEKSIATDSELMKILSEDADETKATTKKLNGLVSDDIKIEKNGIGDDSLPSEVKQEESGVNGILDYQDNQLNIKIDDDEVKKIAWEEPPINLTPFIPEPEAPIDPTECRLRLLDHIEHFQDHIDAQLTTVEAQLCVLEALDPQMDDRSPDIQPRMKQTVQMLLRDLDTVRKLAALC